MAQNRLVGSLLTCSPIVPAQRACLGVECLPLRFHTLGTGAILADALAPASRTGFVIEDRVNNSVKVSGTYNRIRINIAVKAGGMTL